MQNAIPPTPEDDDDTVLVGRGDDETVIVSREETVIVPREETVIVIRGAAVPDEPLSDKEERVLALLADGLSNKQIAATVFLAEGTVKNYVSRIMEKLHARNRTELAVKAATRRG